MNYKKPLGLIITAIIFTLMASSCSSATAFNKVNQESKSEVDSKSSNTDIHEIDYGFEPEEGIKFRYEISNRKLFTDPNFIDLDVNSDFNDSLESFRDEILDIIENDTYSEYDQLDKLYEASKFSGSAYFEYMQNIAKNSIIKPVSSQFLKFDKDPTSVPSAYGDDFYTTYSFHSDRIFDLYNYFYTIEKDDNTYTLEISIADDDGEFSIHHVLVNYYAVDSKFWDDWIKEAVVLGHEEKYLPAYMRVQMAFKTIPGMDRMKHRAVSSINSLLDYTKEKVSLPYIINNQDRRFIVKNMKPDYWVKEDNFGYAIYYDSIYKSFNTERENVEDEVKLLHQLLIEKNILDAVGHYTYVPVFSEKDEVEVYDQSKSIVIESSEPIDSNRLINSYVNFDETFEPISRSEKLFSDSKFEEFVCKILNVTPEHLKIEDLEKIKRLDINTFNKSIDSVKGLSLMTNLEYLDLKFVNIKSSEEFKNLKKLKYLNLAGSSIEDLSNLKELKNLEYLNVDETYVKSLEVLKELPLLKTFKYATFDDVDFKPILSLKKLENISIRGSEENLEILDEIKDQVKELEILNLEKSYLPFPNLEKLSISDCKSSLLVLEKPSKLKNLEIWIAPDLKLDNFINLTQLETLKLNSLDIEDEEFLEHITKLETLKHLNLYSNKLTEIKGIENLKNLESLDISSNKVKRLNGINKLIKLKSLNCSSNEITKIDPINKLSNLENLCISSNNVSNINLIKNLNNLEILDISGNNLNTIDGIKNLKKLKNLDVSVNRLKTIDNIKVLINLESLDISGNKISDISSVENLKGLKNLNIAGNKSKNINSIKNLKELESLNIAGNEITNISSLKNLDNLSELIITYNKISNIEPISNLVKLNDLKVDYNLIDDLSAIKNLNNLKDLDLSKNPFTNIDAIGNLNNLNFLNISDSQITSVDALKNLSKLKRLFLFRTKNIEDLSSLDPLLDELKIFKTDFVKE